MSLRKIAAILNDDGIVTKKGRSWLGSSIQSILKERKK
jgi:hypothetical protein